MPVLSDSWEASSLLNLILSESFALIYSGHWYCNSNFQSCVRQKALGRRVLCSLYYMSDWLQSRNWITTFSARIVCNYFSPPCCPGKRIVMHTLLNYIPWARPESPPFVKSLLPISGFVFYGETEHIGFSLWGLFGWFFASTPTTTFPSGLSWWYLSNLLILIFLNLLSSCRILKYFTAYL